MLTRLVLAGFSIFALSGVDAAVLTTNLLTNPGAELGSINGWTQGAGSSVGVDSGTFDPGISPHTGAYDFYGFTGALGTLYQTVLLVGNQGITAAALDAGNLSADVQFFEQGLNQGAVSDNAFISLAFLNASSATLSSVNTSTIDSHNGAWQGYTGSFNIPVGTRSITYTINFVRNVGSDNDSFVDDNSLTISNNAIVATPEPATPVLITAGIGMLALLRKRRAA